MADVFGIAMEVHQQFIFLGLLHDNLLLPLLATLVLCEEELLVIQVEARDIAESWGRVLIGCLGDVDQIVVEGGVGIRCRRCWKK